MLASRDFLLMSADATSANSRGLCSEGCLGQSPDAAGEYAARWRLSHHARARRRRLRHHLRGRGRQSRHHGRAQGILPLRLRRPRRHHERAPQVGAPQADVRLGPVELPQEARMLARFDHPSIVRVTRVFEANSTAYMVMRLEQGQSFEAWLGSLGRPPTQEELDRIADPLLDALETHARPRISCIATSPRTTSSCAPMGRPCCSTSAPRAGPSAR